MIVTKNFIFSIIWIFICIKIEHLEISTEAPTEYKNTFIYFDLMVNLDLSVIYFK